MTKVLLLIILISERESKWSTADRIPVLRAKIMACRRAKASAIRGDETNVSVAACWDGVTGSSIIQPKPAQPVEGFQAASMKIEEWACRLGFGSRLIIR